MKFRPYALLHLACVALVCLATSCASVGHRTLVPDQFNYGTAIATGSAEQLLMNMIRLRYDVPPVFLTVTSVISQYRRSTNVAAGVGFGSSVTGDDVGSVGVGAAWTDRPTITYAPVSGRDFARTFLTPIKPEQIFALLQSGWPADLAVRLGIVSLNGVKNEASRPARRHFADSSFWEVMEVMRRLREASALGTRDGDGTEGGPTLFLRTHDVAPEVARDQARFRELLFLEPERSEFRLSQGLIPEDRDEIAVLTRSIRDIMVNVAWRFDVPPEHVSDGRTETTFVSPVDPLIEVHFAESHPDEAYVAVESRGYWFYIDDRDRASKRAFSFLHLLLSLTETPDPGLQPVLTIN